MAEGEEWYDSIESAIHAAIGIFSLLLLGLSIFGMKKNGPEDNNTCGDYLFSFRHTTNLGILGGHNWYFGRTSYR